MKTIFKIFGVIALVTLIVISVMACDIGDGILTEVTNLTATEQSGKIALQWTDPFFSSFYAIEISYITDSLQTIIIPKSIERVTIGDLANNREYKFTVKSVDVSGIKTGGMNIYATPVAGVRDNIAPGEVTNIQYRFTDREVIITWTDPADSDLYMLRWFDGFLGGGVFKERQSFTHQFLNSGIEYIITLYTIDITGNESSGVSIPFKTEGIPDNTPPGEVTNVQHSISAEGELILTWTDPEDCDLEWVIYFDGFWSGGVKKGVQSITRPNLNGGTEYTAILYTMDRVWNKSSGVSITFATEGIPDNTPPGKVTNLQYSLPAKGEVIITWTDPADSDLDAIIWSDSIWSGGIRKEIQSLTRSNLDSGVEYIFTFYTIDMIGNIGDPVLFKVTPN